MATDALTLTQRQALVITDLMRLTTRHRRLLLELTRREITQRYVGQMFGALWTIGHPLVLMGVYVFVFSYVFKTRFGGTAELPRNYTVFLLSGLIPWLAFQETISKASTEILSNRNLVKQIVFPIEVLPAKCALSTIPTAVVSLTFLIFYTLVETHALPWTAALLPIVLGCQLMAMIGASYILAAIGVYFRDVKDFVTVFLTAALFIHPILFVPSQMPHWLSYVFPFSPFSYMIWVYQDMLFYGEFVHPWAWPVFGFGSIALLYSGFLVFRSLKVSFGSAM